MRRDDVEDMLSIIFCIHVLLLRIDRKKKILIVTYLILLLP